MNRRQVLNEFSQKELIDILVDAELNGIDSLIIKEFNTKVNDAIASLNRLNMEINDPDVDIAAEKQMEYYRKNQETDRLIAILAETIKER